MQAPAFENVIILVHIVDGKGTAAVPGQGGMLAGQVGDLDFGVHRVRLLLGIQNVHRQGRTGRNLRLRRSGGNRRSQCRRGAAQDQASANGSRS